MKRILVPVLLSISSIFSLQAEDILVINMNGGAVMQVPLRSQVRMTPVMNGWLAIETNELSVMIETNKLDCFKILTDSTSDTRAVIAENNSAWEVYSLKGELVAQGYGLPGFENLPKNEVLILRQNGETVKIRLN